MQVRNSIKILMWQAPLFQLSRMLCYAVCSAYSYYPVHFYVSVDLFILNDLLWQTFSFFCSSIFIYLIIFFIVVLFSVLEQLWLFSCCQLGFPNWLLQLLNCFCIFLLPASILIIELFSIYTSNSMFSWSLASHYSLEVELNYLCSSRDEFFPVGSWINYGLVQVLSQTHWLTQLLDLECRDGHVIRLKGSYGSQSCNSSCSTLSELDNCDSGVGSVDCDNEADTLAEPIDVILGTGETFHAPLFFHKNSSNIF